MAASDEKLLALWNALGADAKAEAVEWFSAEVEWLEGEQGRLIERVLKGLDRDPLAWPAALDPPLYDPTVHAPAQPIARRFVDESAKPHRQVVERIFRKVPERRLVPGWRYDWPRRTVVRMESAKDLDRIALNAIRGFGPRVDLVEAIVEMQLDGGLFAEERLAFGHAYADREGHAYRSVTLYDAWTSSTEMEMPDVECLGVVHDLMDDWKTWVAPIPGSEHRRLYRRIGERFEPVKKYRSLRTALARCYLTGTPVLRDGYAPSRDRLHGIWLLHESDPLKLAATLPDAEGLAEWMDVEGGKVDADLEVWKRAEARRDTLAEEGARVRALFARIVGELAPGKSGDSPSSDGSGDKSGRRTDR